MDLELRLAFATGYERMAAWSDLLDDINLYPVADADTGRNLRISLAPLKNAGHPRIVEHLRSAATGNSGNIAAAFFSRFVAVVHPAELHTAAQSGQRAAWQALLEPQAGTMLTVFDAWRESVDRLATPLTRTATHYITTQLKAAVFSTAEILPALKLAGVVDAGALGMFLFFEGFIKQLAQPIPIFGNPSELFGAKLVLNETNRAAPSEQGYCIDTTIETGNATRSLAQVAALGDSVVALPEGNQLKIHFHTGDGTAAREKLSRLGTVVRWRQEKIEEVSAPATIAGAPRPGVHIATDAAGSLPRASAKALGITLLDSYLIMGEQHLPETLVDPEALYAAMRQGIKVTTAQASIFERHQAYQSLLERNEQSIYLCVGSLYTGNYDIACQWQAQSASNGRLTIIDTTAASGRLGLIAVAVARFAHATPPSSKTLEKVRGYAQSAIAHCQELIFIDQLKYLAAGGRISKTRGFFGDLFNVKPVISPRTQGVEKIGAVKTSAEQRKFAMDYLNKHLPADQPADILISYTDNQDWVRTKVCSEIESRFPLARMVVHPLSLTSGVHMGPGTWAVAFLPEIKRTDK